MFLDSGYEIQGFRGSDMGQKGPTIVSGGFRVKWGRILAQ